MVKILTRIDNNLAMIRKEVCMAVRFGQQLFSARKAKRLILRKLSQLTDLSISYLSDIEHGRKMPPRDEEKIRDLAIALDIDPEEFLEMAKMECKWRRPEFFKRFFERLFKFDPDLARDFCYEVENASDDEFRLAIETALNVLKKKKNERV